MKKDITMAIIIGFVIGAIAAVGIVVMPTFFKKDTTLPNEVAKNVSITPEAQVTSVAPSALDVTEPKDESIATSKSIRVIGKTFPSSIVLVDSDTDSTMSEAGADGNFSVPFTLTEGSNTIVVSSYTDKGDEQTKTLTVYYTAENL